LKKGSAIVNKLIDKLPIELHLPGYNFCGPGTKLTKRLARGDSGVNLLDSACKVHDIAYSETTDLNKRHEADKVLIEKARERLKAKDSSFGEKAAAATVLGIMKAKVKLGMGSRKRSKRSKKSKRGRILVAPKSGGFLPFLLPLLGAFGALGVLKLVYNWYQNTLFAICRRHLAHLCGHCSWYLYHRITENKTVEKRPLHVFY
jgi:hypothetical protein